MNPEPVRTTPPLPQLDEVVRRRWWERGPEAVAAHPPAAGEVVVQTTPLRPDRPAGAGQLVARVVTDVIARHRTMDGDPASGVTGWDSHAPAIEQTVARERADAGLDPGAGDAVVDACATAVARAVAVGDQEHRALGCAGVGDGFRTDDPGYLDSVWWSLAQLWESGLVQEAPRMGPWCTVCRVTLSSDEVLDGPPAPSRPTLVRFPVAGEGGLRLVGASLLVQVAAASTLPAVTAVAFDPDATYVLAQASGDDYPVVIASGALDEVLGPDARVHRPVGTDELGAVRYRPPIHPPIHNDAAGEGRRDVVVAIPDAAAIPLGGTEPGRTGLRALAPAVATPDLRLARAHGIAVVDPPNAAAPGTRDAAAVADADDVLVTELRGRGLVVDAWTRDRAVGRCGRCGRCGTAVIDRARPTLFVGEATDWPVSHDRWWGTPLPFWRCDGCGQLTVFAGRAELAAATGTHVDDLDVRRPAIDAVTVPCGACHAGTARRIPGVVTSTYETATAPFARFGFPALAGSDARVAHGCHVDVLVDVEGDGRWTDALRRVSRLLWNADGVATRRRLDADTGAADDGAGDALALAAEHGADTVRWAALIQPARWAGTRDRRTLILGAARVLRTVWHSCSFFTTYARLDGWTSRDADMAPDVGGRGVLDRWILAELADTVDEVSARLGAVDPTAAATRIAGFADDLSHWYVRRSRRRFTPGGDTTPVDRACAYATLHECLVTLAALLAPFTPFLADELFERLVRHHDPAAPDTVHQLRFPTADPVARDRDVRAVMAATRRIAELGRRARNDAGVATRQPLHRAVVTAPEPVRSQWEYVAPLLAEELNIKQMEIAAAGASAAPAAERWQVAADGTSSVALDLAMDPLLRSEGLARDVIRAVNDLRRRHAMEHGQHITLRIDADPEVAAAVETHRQAIAADVLATRIELGPTEHGVAVPLGSGPVRVAVREAVTR